MLRIITTKIIKEVKAIFRRYRYPFYWQEMDRLQREMNKLYDTFQPGQGQNVVSYPAMNIWANDENAIVTAEVAGVDPKDIDISVVGRNLTVSGSKMPEETAENVKYHRQERGYGKFARSIQLPFNINMEKVEASFKDGVLSIQLPRAEEDKPKKIKVKAA